ncbi:mucin-5AC-like [Lucilia cuprina]|uniref:mucin-5AC-like n=1 Tax=Lucilia cuprina TaxID=7375 RepID=UPI001F0600A5|nr:mucin-5AC-like [Lucilia cuprina]
MFKQLCLLIITTLYWQPITGRHLVPANYHSLQQPYYLPYNDYGYTYAAAANGAGPYQPAYPQPYPQHSPLYSPPGTYFDQRRGILRPFPGGGVPVLVDYHKRCSNQYVGVKAHPEQHQYYYVCKPDCVIFGKCQNLQIFNNTSGQCVQNPPPEYIPTCSGVGRFPLFSDCHLYYKCEEDLQPKIYSCPAYMVFSPASKKCINGNKCTPTQISPHSSYIPEYCSNKFPPCYENGIFRSPSDCSLYYKCDLQKNGVYMQTRSRCPTGKFYDLQKSECLPSEQVPCDCIQVAELVYPKVNSISYQPAMYPAQYDFDSLEENLYPVEQSAEEMNTNCNITETKSDKSENLAEEEVTSTEAPETLATTLVTDAVEQNDSGADVLSDYLDIENSEPKNQSEEIEHEAEDLIATTISSEEGSGSETDTTEQSHDEENSTILDDSKSETDDPIMDSTAETEEVEATSATTENVQEETDQPDVLIEEPEQESVKEEENEVITTKRKEETTTTSTTVLGKITDIPEKSVKPEPCENIIENDESNDKPLPTDIPFKDTSQTQNKTCLPKLTTTSSDSVKVETEPTRTTLDSTFTRGSRSTILEQNLTTITPTVTVTTTTTQLPTTIMTPTADSLETTKLPQETIIDIEKDSLVNETPESNLLDSETNLETAETTQSSERTTAVTRETTHKPEANSLEDNSLKEEKILNSEEQGTDFTTLQTPTEDHKQFTQTIHTRSVESSSLEHDISYDDLSDIKDNDITSNTAQTSTNQPSSVHTSKESDDFSLESEISQENDITRTDFPEESKTDINDIAATPLKISESQENTEILETTTELPQTEILQTTTETLKPKTEDENTDKPSDLDDEFALLDSEINIDNFESTTLMAEDILNTNSMENEEFLNTSTLENEELLPLIKATRKEEHKSLNEKSVTLRQADFSGEEFLPVHSKTTNMEALTDQTTDFNYITEHFVDDSEDDYTTVIGDKETTTKATIGQDINEIEEERKEEVKTSTPKDEETTSLATASEELKELEEISNSIETEHTTTLKSQEKDTTTTTAVSQEQTEMPEISNSIEQEKTDEDKSTTILKRRQTSPEDTTQLTTATPPIQNTLAADSSATANAESSTIKEETLNNMDNSDDTLAAVLDSEVVLNDQSDEVSNNEITSAETTTAKQQFPNTHSTTFTPTQTPTTTPKYTTTTNTTESTSEPCEKHSNHLVLHVRDEDQKTPTTQQDRPFPSKSLYYILKTKPVINTNKNSHTCNNNNKNNNNINKSCNETVAAPPCVETDNGNIPRLEIIAERPIDVHFSVCPSTCDKDHKHNFANNRAVFLRWFANKSKQTMGFETVNEVNTSDAKDC